MLHAIPKEQQTPLWKKGKRILRLEQWNNEVYPHLRESQAILIESTVELDFEEIVQKVRTHPSFEVFNKPIFTCDQNTSNLVVHTDGQVGKVDTERIINQIHQKCNDLHPIHTHDHQKAAAIKTLQWMYTRQGTLTPRKSRTTQLCYSYPYLDIVSTFGPRSLQGTIDLLKHEHAIQTQIMDRLQLCKKCLSGFLVFKETCPRCNSIDLLVSDVIHHFVCAHVAPEKDFMTEGADTLCCPKCDKHLRHIGIDYDKPSAVYQCKTCTHKFQHATMVAACHDCDRDNALEELEEFEVEQLTLTKLGIDIATRGSFFDQVKHRQKGIHEAQNFYLLVDHEKHRKSRNSYGSFLVTIDISSESIQRLPKPSLEKFSKEIHRLLHEYVSAPSYIRQEGLTWSLLWIDLKKAQAKDLQLKLERNLEILLTDNMDAKTQLRVYLEPLRK